MNTSTLRIAVFLVPCLVLLGCGKDLPRVRTVPLAGDTAGLGNLEGDWYDEDGFLVVGISGGRSPELAVRLSPWMKLTGARAEAGRVSFHIDTDRSLQPYSSSLDREGGQDFVISRNDPSPGKSGCMPWADMNLQLSHLVHDPPPFWVMKQSARRTTQVAGKVAGRARDEVMDRMARAL
jgi:hypothetical protein